MTPAERQDTCVRRPCRVYNLWPENKIFRSRSFKPSFDDREISLYIRTFLNRANFSEPALSLNGKVGCSHIRLGKDIGFWLGNIVVGDPGEGSPIPIGRGELIPRFQGEIDIGLMFSKGQEYMAKLENVLYDVIDISVPFLAATLKDYSVFNASTQMDEFTGDGLNTSSPQTLAVLHQERSRISEESLTEVLDRLCLLVETMSIETLRGLAVACRRLNSAALETDIIDKYCDFWECCEFLAPSGRRVNEEKLPRAKDAAITHLLCNYVQPSKHSRLIIRNKIHNIYIVRNDLVHNAMEDPDVVKENLALLDEIASHLFRYRVGVPFEPTPNCDGCSSGARPDRIRTHPFHAVLSDRTIPFPPTRHPLTRSRSPSVLSVHREMALVLVNLGWYFPICLDIALSICSQWVFLCGGWCRGSSSKKKGL
jgi:hypothetical protein